MLYEVSGSEFRSYIITFIVLKCPNKDMNEPSNFYNGHKDGCVQNNLNYPEYLPNVVGNQLATKTLCMNAKHYLSSHYNLHNTYGTSQAIATNE